MSRTNLDGTACGESRRFTVRVSRCERAALTWLCEKWAMAPSAAIRRALLAAATAAERQQREALVAAVPAMSAVALRQLAAQLHIRGRSKMSKATLRHAVCQQLERSHRFD